MLSSDSHLNSAGNGARQRRLLLRARFLTLALAALFSFGQTGDSLAQNGDDGWAGGIYAGYAGSTDDNAPDGSFGGMFNAFAMLAPALGIGAELGFYRLGSVDSVFTDKDDNSVPGKIDYFTWQTTGAVMATSQSGKLRPFGVGGLGLYGVRTDEEALNFGRSETNTKFGFNLGGGIKFLPSNNSPWGVGIDLRWHRIMDTLEGGTRALNVFTGLVGLTFSP